MVGKIIENKIPLGIRLKNGGSLESEEKKLDLNIFRKNYKRGFTSVIKEVREIQEVLK